MSTANKRQVIDAHLHAYDHQATQYKFLDNVDEMFGALIGDYSALPRRYLLDDFWPQLPQLLALIRANPEIGLP